MVGGKERSVSLSVTIAIEAAAAAAAARAREIERNGERKKRKSNPIASHDLLWHADCCCCWFLFCRQTPRHSKMKTSNFFFISSENWRLAVLDRSPPVYLTSPHLLTCNPSPLCLFLYTVRTSLTRDKVGTTSAKPKHCLPCIALHSPPTFPLHHRLTDRILMMDRGP